MQLIGSAKADLFLIQYDNGILDETYQASGYRVLRVGKWTDDAPMTIDFIKENNRLYFYGLFSEGAHSSGSAYGAWTYAFALSFEGSLDKDAMAASSGIAYKQVYNTVLISDFKAYSASIKNRLFSTTKCSSRGKILEKIKELQFLI